MTIRPIREVERELAVVRRIDDRNRHAVEASDRPLVDAVFASSSEKRRKLLERELMEAKADRAHELFGLRLHSPQFSKGTIPLRVLVKLAPILNNALEQSAWREWDLEGDARSIEDGFRRLINIRLAGVQEGSTELLLMGNTAPDLTGESALESGLRNLFDVLSSPNERLADVVNGIGKNATKSVVQLMRVFETENMAAELRWRAPDRELHWDGRPNEITRIRALLEEFGEPRQKTIVTKGVVSALTRKRVQIETRDGEKINARYHRSLSETVNGLHLDERRTFEVQVTSYPSDSLGLRQDAYRLLRVLDGEDLSPIEGRPE